VAIYGVALNGLCYQAWNSQTDSGQTGDSGNHTLKIVRDGQEFTPQNNPSEVDSANCPGLYQINLVAFEMSSNTIVLMGKSSTAHVSIIPVTITTTPENSD
jgi:hypothetical protein